MGNLVLVKRDYPHLYDMFTAVGPLLRDKGVAPHQIAWKTGEDYETLGDLNGRVEEGLRERALRSLIPTSTRST